MAAACFRAARSLQQLSGTFSRVKISVSTPSLQGHSLFSRKMQSSLDNSTLCRYFSSLSLSPTSTTATLRPVPPRKTGCLAVPHVPVRTVVKHSKLGKMKTVKAVAKRFRRTGSGKLKFWPPGNVHNLLSKSHNRKCRIRRPRYASKSQAKTLNKMLIGRYS